MRVIESKQHILDALEKLQSASLAELLKELGESFVERSVRRWLKELAQEHLVEKTGHARATRYKLADKFSSKAVFNPTSQKIIAQINQPLFHRNPVAYNAQWLDEYQPNKTFYLSAAQRTKLMAEGRREHEHDPAGTYARKIYNRLLIDLSYNSSRLEGNTYSLLETEKLLLQNVNSENKLSEETAMILNHKEAICDLVENIARIKIEFNDLATVHFLLSDGLIESQYTGKIRDHGVRISSSAYLPLENSVKIANKFEIICNKARQIKDPFEQSFFLLVHIAYLQAFADVNKRTARLAANIPLLKNNLVPLSFNDVNKDDYIASMLAIYEFNSVEPLADVYCASYFRTCMQYSLAAKNNVYDEIRVRFRQQRRELIRHIILNKLATQEWQSYVNTQAKKIIPADALADFIQDIHEDLELIAPERLAGLGVSKQELEAWQRIKK